MAQFIVSASQLEQKKNDLIQKRNKFLSVISELERDANSLYTMWEGDAKENFKKSLTKDISTLRSFIEELNEFISTLNEIITTYRNTERNNAALASS